MLGKHERPRQCHLHPLRHDLGCLGRANAGKRQREFVAAGARHPVGDVLLIGMIQCALGVAQAILQTMSDFLQQHVAHCLSLCVVDSGKVVDIEHQHREAALSRQGPFDLLFQYLQQALAIGQSGERVVVGEVAHARLALPQLVLSLFGSHQEFDALREQHGVDALGGEIRGSRVVCAIDRLHVIETGLHQYRYVTALRHCTQGAAYIEAAHSRHDHVEHHAIRGMLAKSAERSRPVGRGDDAKTRHFQGGSGQQPCAGIVVHHQHGCRNVDLIFDCVHRFLEGLRAAATRRWVTVRASARCKILDTLCGFSTRSVRPA